MIKISNLKVKFGNSSSTVLDDINFYMNYGDKILLIGPSGHGKSVFLKVLMGLIPEQFVTGDFYVESQKLRYHDYRQHKIHKKFSTIFQDAINSLHPYRDIKSQFFGKSIKLSDNELEKEFKKFRLIYSNIKNEYPCRLSGGQCQRISMLFPYLVKGRDIIFFDEPITDIDPISRPVILKVIKERFLNNNKKTIIYVTHSYQELLNDRDIKFRQYEIHYGKLKENHHD
ncbi:hypothetical protein GMMP15_1400005 [Candidatus Magnetomoraceae bacterium gMMP-15]